jgi:hypothetical protein
VSKVHHIHHSEDEVSPIAIRAPMINNETFDLLDEFDKRLLHSQRGNPVHKEGLPPV